METLYDDRIDQAAGVKFNDADLLGLPLRLVVSPRNLKNGQVEVKGRTDAEAEMVPLGRGGGGRGGSGLRREAGSSQRDLIPQPACELSACFSGGV